MIAERLPELAAMTREEKWEVLHELEEELGYEHGLADDPQVNDLETKVAVAELLKARMAEYEAHPETARPWHEVRASIQQRFEAWKADRRHTA
jgi:hypothetical protein